MKNWHIVIIGNICWHMSELGNEPRKKEEKEYSPRLVEDMIGMPSNALALEYRRKPVLYRNFTFWDDFV